LDVSMPIMDGLEALPHVRTTSPRTQVVMYTGFDSHGLAERAKQLGASAFLEKSTASKPLPDELARVLALDPARPRRPRVVPEIIEAGSAGVPAAVDERFLDEHVE